MPQGGFAVASTAESTTQFMAAPQTTTSSRMCVCTRVALRDCPRNLPLGSWVAGIVPRGGRGWWFVPFYVVHGDGMGHSLPLQLTSASSPPSPLRLWVPGPVVIGGLAAAASAAAPSSTFAADATSARLMDAVHQVPLGKIGFVVEDAPKLDVWPLGCPSPTAPAFSLVPQISTSVHERFAREGGWRGLE